MRGKTTEMQYVMPTNSQNPWQHPTASPEIHDVGKFACVQEAGNLYKQNLCQKSYFRYTSLRSYNYIPVTPELTESLVAQHDVQNRYYQNP